MDPKELEAIERELLELIVQNLQNNSLNPRKARRLARDFLGVLPVQDRADLLEKLKNLGNTYNEAKQLYAKESAKITANKEQQALAMMSTAIQQGNIDHALSVAKELKAKEDQQTP